MEKIVVVGYGQLTQFIQSINYSPPEFVDLTLISCGLHETVQKVLKLEREDHIDVFVSAGANARLLSKSLKTTLVEVRVTGLDILHALRKAGTATDKVGILTFDEKMPGLDEILDILTIQVEQATYDQQNDIEIAISKLLNMGINTIVGSSYVVEKVELMGARGVLLYSPTSIIMALDSAVQIALSKRIEKKRVQELNAILKFAYGGIIAVDENGIISVFNHRAERITGFFRDDMIGKNIVQIFPKAKWNLSHQNRGPELNRLQHLGKTKVSTNLVPIFVGGSYAGSVLTLQDIPSIQAAEKAIRVDLSTRGFTVSVNFDDIICTNKKMIVLKEIGCYYAKSNSTVLITGETGTGKELFAKSIHSASSRSRAPFMAINCAAFPESLLESELFGYEAGAFTGARKGGKLGLFEIADGGTVFLDEIADMPLHLQTRLLRVLEDRKVIPVGGVAFRNIDIRVVVATNRNLWKMVIEDKFREDLYYRINVLNMHIPPLRERKEDIPSLVKKFLQEFSPNLPNQVVQKVCKYHKNLEYSWMGNVRELRHLIERFCVLYPAKRNLSEALRLSSTFEQVTKSRQDEKIAEVLEKVAGNKSKAAEKLGISRTTLWRRQKKMVS